MTEVAVSLRIAASADRLWALLGDPGRMGEWSDECRRVDWIDGATGPALDARFHGHNRIGWRRWTTTGRIVNYDPPRNLTFDVSMFGQPIARWSYDLAPDGDGTKVTERFVDLRGALSRRLGPVARGVADTAAHNRAGMQRTLEKVRAAAEG
jgi:uncharacterized protein YndB with AHSA1/START domain